LAHAFAEYCLREGCTDAKIHIGMVLPEEKGKEQPLTEAMAGYINTYLDAVYDELGKAPDAELYVEQHFELHVDSAPNGSVFGTNDAMVYTPSRKRLAVFDLKYGAGVSVRSEDNAQLKFYACGGALSHADWLIEEVELFIVQPRAFDAGSSDGVRPWSMPVLELLDFPADVDKAIADAESCAMALEQGVIADANELPLVAGDWCKFCPAAAICTASQNNAFKLAALDFKDVAEVTAKTLPAPSSIDTERLGKILHAKDILDAWFSAVEKHALELAESGVGIPGWKLVDKMARRKYLGNKDEAAAFLMLALDADEDAVTPRELLTITDAERLIKATVQDKKVRASLIEDYALKYTIKESSGRTLAPASDKRPAANAVTADFASVAIPAAD